VKRLAYVTARMPFAFAEQFFEPEIASLGRWFDVTVIPTRATDRTDRYPGLLATKRYLGVLDLEVLGLAAREVIRAPSAVLAAFGEVAFARGTWRARAVNLALFPKALALAADLRARRIEHVHVNWMTSSATIVHVASRLTKIPYSITAHQHDIFYDNMTVPKVRRAEFVRVISDRNRAHLEALLPPELHAKCHTVFLGVEPPAAPATPPARVPRILCAARMCLWKGHRYLLPALAALRDAGIAFACDLAGDGEVEADIRALVERFALGDRVTMLGNVPHGALVRALEAGHYDLCVLASTERAGEHEGIPVALMEAMAARLPVVATRTGSIPELVDERSGILVPQADPAALAAALATLLADPERRRQLGDAGRTRILADFETVATSARLADMLQESAPWDIRGRGDVPMGQKS